MIQLDWAQLPRRVLARVAQQIQEAKEPSSQQRPTGERARESAFLPWLLPMPILALRSADKSGKMIQYRIPGMKWQAIISLVVAAGLATASAEDSPLPSPSPKPGTSEMEEPALPAPEAAPSNLEPDLLPGAGELPARPPSEVPSKLSPDRASPPVSSEKEGRFDEIRSLAMSDLRAAYLLKRARHSSNSASRRLYLRAYYVTVAARMRKLDPKLKSSIDAYEEAQIHEIYGAQASTARVSSHRSRVHGTASRERRHRSHKVAYQHRYRRFINIDYPYGPPYGPEFGPYGPPMVFYPW
jgi:hypothetical protein